MTKKKKRIENIIGWMGIVFIQGSVLPPTYSILMGNSNNVPPLSMVLAILIGVSLFLIRAILQKDTVAIVSNIVGFITQGLLMCLIVFK